MNHHLVFLPYYCHWERADSAEHFSSTLHKAEGTLQPDTKVSEALCPRPVSKGSDREEDMIEGKAQWAWCPRPTLLFFMAFTSGSLVQGSCKLIDRNKGRQQFYVELLVTAWEKWTLVHTDSSFHKARIWTCRVRPVGLIPLDMSLTSCGFGAWAIVSNYLNNFFAIIILQNTCILNQEDINPFLCHK